jgi:protein subunit release factor B
MKHLVFSVTIKDCKVQTFRSGGKGGQHQNKTESGVRIIHHPSGARGESREHRHQIQNKRAAWQRMANTKEFQNWCRAQVVRRRMNRTLEEIVEEMMSPENLLVEYLPK